MLTFAEAFEDRADTFEVVFPDGHRRRVTGLNHVDSYPRGLREFYRGAIATRHNSKPGLPDQYVIDDTTWTWIPLTEV